MNPMLEHIPSALQSRDPSSNTLLPCSDDNKEEIKKEENEDEKLKTSES